MDTDAPTIQADTTTPGAVMGTPAYMSPEQARGQEVDKRTDVWAFGCCLFECLSGRKPFQGPTASELIAEVLKTEPDWSQLPSETPREVVTLLRRCLEKEPTRRLSSMGDIALTLEETTRTPASSSSAQAPQVSSAPPPSSFSFEASAKWLRPLAVGLLILAIWAGVYYRKRSGSNRISQVGSDLVKSNAVPLSSAVSVTDQKSIAVLPFVNMSADKDNEYLSDGITEDLCTALAQVRGLRVPARTSSFVFKDKTDDIQKIGQQLRVANVLEGSVSQSGKKLRINAQLISVADGFHLWATNYDREMSDLLTLRSEIAQQVVAAMRVQLLPSEKQLLAKKGTENPEAYRLYLLGRSFFNQRSIDGLKKAQDYFEQALVKDPDYALARVGVADYYLVLPTYTGVPTKDALPKARAAALAALRLDNTLGEAYVALGYFKEFEWDWQGAESDYRQGIELTPNYTDIHGRYCILLLRLGRLDEANREARRAQALDPLSPQRNALVGFTLFYQGQYDQALIAYRTVLELNPNFHSAHTGLGDAYVMKQMYSEAITEHQSYTALAGKTPRALGRLGYAYGISGRLCEARKVLDELDDFSQQAYETRYQMALVYNGLGDREKAWGRLEEAIERREDGIFDLKANPLWQNLRSEPRSIALLKKMGLDK